MPLHINYFEEHERLISSKPLTDNGKKAIHISHEGINVYVNIPNGYESEDFGSSVATTKNLSAIAVGSPSTNQVFIFQGHCKRYNISVEAIAVLTNDGYNGVIECGNFGKTLNISDDGNYLIIDSDNEQYSNIVNLNCNDKGELELSNSLVKKLVHPNKSDITEESIAGVDSNDNFCVYVSVDDKE